MLERGVAEMARCLRVRRVLQSYLDGHADRKTEVRVARHLEACRRCGNEARVYNEIRNAIARRGGRSVDDASVRRLQELAEHLADSDDIHTDADDPGDTGERP